MIYTREFLFPKKKKNNLNNLMTAKLQYSKQLSILSAIIII